MKKILLFVMACITSVCLYANTCTYDGVQVSLYSENIEYNATGAWITVTTNKTNISEVRCQINVNGKRFWVNIPINQGSGRVDISSIAGLNYGSSYKVTLVAGAGQCY